MCTFSPGIVSERKFALIMGIVYMYKTAYVGNTCTTLWDKG